MARKRRNTHPYPGAGANKPPHRKTKELVHVPGLHRGSRVTGHGFVTHSKIVSCEIFEGRPPINLPVSVDHPIAGRVPLKARWAAACLKVRNLPFQEVIDPPGAKTQQVLVKPYTHRIGREFVPKCDPASSEKYAERNVKVIHMATNKIRSRSFLLHSLDVCSVCSVLQNPVCTSVQNHESFKECIPGC